MNQTTVKQQAFEYKSPVMKEIFSEIEDYANHGRSCIFFGPTGVGKEFAARHYFKIFSEFNKGKYISINCAGLTYELAVSELFGHLKGSFSGAFDNKIGLFEEAKGGLLFLDEIGDLPAEVQPVLLRAIDPHIGEAKKVGATAAYSTKDVMVIAATERPENIRQSLLERFEKRISIPGIDQRMEDVPGAVKFYLKSALFKRRDSSEVINKLAGRIVSEAEWWSEKDIDNLLDSVANKIVPLVYEKSWPGNFRSLRIAVDTAIVRAKKFSSRPEFGSEVTDLFRKYSDNYSVSIKKNIPEPTVEKVINDSNKGDFDQQIFQKVAHALARIPLYEKYSIAKFLTMQKNIPFSRNDFESILNSKSSRTAQLRLKEMVEKEILTRAGNKGDEYIFKESNEIFAAGKPYFLNLPPDIQWPVGKERELAEAEELLANIHAIFISGEKASGKSAFVQALGITLSSKRPVYYYAFGYQGVSYFLNLLTSELVNRGIVKKLENIEKEDANLVIATQAENIGKLLGKNEKPVLILDNIHSLSRQQDVNSLLSILKYWAGITFVFVGIKMNNEFHFSDKSYIVEININ